MKNEEYTHIKTLLKNISILLYIPDEADVVKTYLLFTGEILLFKTLSKIYMVAERG